MTRRRGFSSVTVIRSTAPGIPTESKELWHEMSGHAAAGPASERFRGKMIETLRRFCLDAVIVLDDHHAERILREFVAYLPWASPSWTPDASDDRGTQDSTGAADACEPCP